MIKYLIANKWPLVLWKLTMWQCQYFNLFRLRLHLEKVVNTIPRKCVQYWSHIYTRKVLIIQFGYETFWLCFCVSIYCKGFPLQAWCGSWGSRRLRLLGRLDIRHYEGGKVVTLTHRPSLPPRVFLVLIFRGWVDPRAHGSVCSFGKNPQRHHRGSIPRPSDYLRSALTTTLPQTPSIYCIKANMLWAWLVANLNMYPLTRIVASELYAFMLWRKSLPESSARLYGSRGFSSDDAVAVQEAERHIKIVLNAFTITRLKSSALSYLKSRV
jgi:hypothetical protein